MKLFYISFHTMLDLGESRFISFKITAFSKHLLSFRTTLKLTCECYSLFFFIKWSTKNIHFDLIVHICIKLLEILSHQSNSYHNCEGRHMCLTSPNYGIPRSTKINKHKYHQGKCKYICIKSPGSGGRYYRKAWLKYILIHFYKI